MWVTSERWNVLMTEYLRVLKPGGWIQITEQGMSRFPRLVHTMAQPELISANPNIDSCFHSDHPAIANINQIFKLATERVNPDLLPCSAIKQCVSRAGFASVTMKTIEVPIGEWSDQPGMFLTLTLWRESSPYSLTLCRAITFRRYGPRGIP